jgi:hypothetical protein
MVFCLDVVLLALLYITIVYSVQTSMCFDTSYNFMAVDCILLASLSLSQGPNFTYIEYSKGCQYFMK